MGLTIALRELKTSCFIGKIDSESMNSYSFFGKLLFSFFW